MRQTAGSWIRHALPAVPVALLLSGAIVAVGMRVAASQLVSPTAVRVASIAPAPTPTPNPLPTSAPRSRSLRAVAPWTVAPPPDPDTLSDPERQDILDILNGSRRDEPWASATESALRLRLDGVVDGLTITAVTCTDGVCAVEAQLAASVIHDRPAAIALLVKGPLDRSYGEIGLTKLGTATINADDVGNLSVTQYIARPF
jgi:hypothetical protein